AIAAGNFKSIGEEEFEDIRVADHDFLKVSLFIENLLYHPSLIIRKHFLKAYNLKYEETFDYAGDYDLLVRAASKGKLVNIAQILFHYRRHTSWLSASYQEHTDEVDRVRLHQLQYLGVVPSDEEKQLHLKFVSQTSIDYVKKDLLFKWIDKLITANSRVKYYHDAYFIQMLQSLLKQQPFISASPIIVGNTVKLEQKKKYDLNDV